MTQKHKYSQEQIAFLENNITGRSFRELTVMFNARFGLNLSQRSIDSACDRRKLINGRDVRYKAGCKAWNAGLKCPGSGRNGWFLKGNKPWSCCCVGTEQVNPDDYVEIKIADPNKWRTKHLVLWEAINGPLPPGHVIIFADSNRRNFDLENLLLLTKRELALMNRLRLISTDAEITKTQLNIARILLKCSERKKR